MIILIKAAKMLTIEQIKKRLEHSNLKAVAAATGVHFNTVYRLVNGGSEPSYKTVKLLSDYLESMQ
jgi:transcriptional regulator with XRE-family HTH domain